MAFDPDEYLTEKGQGVTFDPDAYLDKKTLEDASTSFDPDKYLDEKEIEQQDFYGSENFANAIQSSRLPIAEDSLQSYSESPEGFVENAKFIADDVNNQFNNNLAIIAGAPVDLIALGLNKASNTIFDQDIVASNSLGGSESFRRGIEFITGARVRDEPAKTRAGVFAGVTADAITFTMPLLKVAQVTSKVQATSKAGQIGVNLAKQFTDEATRNTGRFLAIESGAVAGQSGGRILSQEKDLSPGATLAVELLTGITGALAGDKTFGVSRALINKTRGKTAQEIMESVAKGDITYKDLTFTPKEKPLFQRDGTFNIDESLPVSQSETGGTVPINLKELEFTPAPKETLLTPPKETPLMPGITRQNFDEARSEIASNLLATQRTQLAVDAGDLNNYAPGSNKRPNRLFNRINSWLAPSKVVGREVMNEIDQAKGIIREAESVGIRTYNAVERVKKANPNDAAAIDKNVKDFLLGGELDPLLVPIRTELSAWRSSTNKLRERLIAGMDDQTFMDLSPEIRQGLRNALEGSMDDKGGYLTTPYRLFEDPNFTPDPKLKKAALAEIKLKFIDEGYSSKVAAKKAQEKLDELRGNSAKTRELESNGGFRPVASESILRQQTFPGPAERAWLGEITEAGQRALLTSRKLSRLASAKAEDAEIANILLDSGVASRTAREGQVELKLKTVSGKTNIYVDPEVADSIYKLRYGQMVNRGIRNPMGKALDAFFTVNFLAKFTKVIGNVGSYPVAALGSLTSAMSNGIMPNFSGMRRAAASFRSLENFVAGKSPQAKKEFYADLDKMDLYNLRPKSVDAADMEATLKKGFEILNKNILGKAIDIGGKAYSAFDVAMRYVTWKATQKELGKMFPNYTKEQIEAAAARMTNDTFPNYDKLSDIVREGAKYIFQPFIAHFAELSRVSYNQGKFALQMMRGNFGRDFGLDPSGANKMSMRMLGAKRLAALALVTAGAKTLVKSKNEDNGLDDKSVQQFKESILPPWMEATTAIIKPNKDDPRRGFYVPPEYIIPQLGMTDAFSAAMNGRPFEDYQAILKNRIFSQEGSLALQAVTKIFTGKDQRGREIYIDPSFSAQAKVIGESLFDDIVKPGTFRTYEKFSDAINGIGDRTVAQEVQSLFGYRVNTYDTDRAFRSKFREQSSLMKRAKSDYTSAFRDRVNGSINQQDLDVVYNEMNTARRNRLDLVRGHYGNMGMELLKYTLDEKIAIMKEGSLSSLDILDVIGGTYTDMPRNITDKTKDRYDEIPGNLNAKGKAILSLPQSDPYRKKLGLYHKKQLKAESQNIDAVDSLIISLTPEQTADYLIRIGADKNSKILNTYLKKDPARLEIIKILDVRSSN